MSNRIRIGRGYCATTWLGMIALAIAACSGPSAALSMPPLPQLSLEQAHPAVRERLELARDKALGNPRDAQANGEFAMALSANRQSADAAICFERARALDPDDYRWAYLHGLALEELGDSAAARSAIATATQLNADYTPAQAKLAQLMLASGEVAASDELVSRLLQREPQRADVQFVAGRLRAEQDELDAARYHYERALVLNGPFAAGYYALADVYRKQGLNDQAAQQLDLYQANRDAKLKVEDPVRAERDRKSASDQSHIQRAQGLARKGDFDGAAAALGKALQVNPDNANTVASLILVYRRQGDLEKAQDIYQGAQERDVQNVAMHFNMGNFYLDVARPSQAAKAFERVLDLRPGHADALAQLGLIEEQRGRVSSAKALYERAVAQDPAHKQAGYQLGRLLALEGDYTQGIARIEAVLEPPDDNTPRFLHTLAGIYAKSGDLNTGIELLTRADAILATAQDGASTALRNRVEADRRMFVRLKNANVEIR